LIGIASIAQPQWGVKAGVNFNQIKLDNAPFLPEHYFRNNTGFHIGGFGEFSLNRNQTNFLHIGLQFIQRGANSANYNTSPAQETRINLYYLEAPVLISRKLFKIMYVELGPSISYKLYSREAPADDSKNLGQVFPNKVDFGLNGGLRVAIYQQISIWSRYYQGFSQTSHFPNVFFDLTPETTQKNFQIGLGYSFK